MRGKDLPMVFPANVVLALYPQLSDLPYGSPGFPVNLQLHGGFGFALLPKGIT